MAILKLIYDNEIRKEAMWHAQHMAATSYTLGRTFWSYKGGRNNNDETAYLGKIAECIIRRWFLENKLKIEKSPLDKEAYERPESNFNSDYIINDHTIELKTKTINCEPKGDYDVGTTRISAADIYVFSRIRDEIGVLYLCGWILTDEFRVKAVYRQKGTQVVNSRDSEFKCLSNEYVLAINQLKEPLELIKELQ